MAHGLLAFPRTKTLFQNQRDRNRTYGGGGGLEPLRRGRVGAFPLPFPSFEGPFEVPLKDTLDIEFRRWLCGWSY